MTNTHKPLGRSIIVLFFVIAAGFFFGKTKAEEPCKTPEALSHLANVKKNQPVISENRPAYTSVKQAVESGAEIDPDNVDGYNAFIRNKIWNESENDAIHKLGCQIDWKTLELVPFKPGAVSPEKLHSSATKSEVSHASPKDANQLWIWEGAPDYKNDRLKAYQGMLVARGITDPEQLKLLTAQIIQENGSLSENVHGDNGCSVGVLQYNACVHHKMNAKRFLETHPEWQSWEYQFERMADMVANRMDIYDGNLRKVVIHHNCPACTNPKTTKWKAVGQKYYSDVSSNLPLLQAL